MNALIVMVFSTNVLLLPSKLSSLLNLLICTTCFLFSPLMVLAPHSTPYNFSKIINRSFRNASPHLWNQLPVSFRQPSINHSPDDVTSSHSSSTCSPLSPYHAFTISFQSQNSPLPQIFSVIVW